MSIIPSLHINHKYHYHFILFISLNIKCNPKFTVNKRFQFTHYCIRGFLPYFYSYLQENTSRATKDSPKPAGTSPESHRQKMTPFVSFLLSVKRFRVLKAIVKFCGFFLVKMTNIGGLAVPDIYKYHQAAHLTRVLDWCRHGDHKIWTHLKQQFSTIPLHSAPWCFRALPFDT